MRITHANNTCVLYFPQGNRLGGEGLFHLCSGLEQNKSLTDLNISDNELEGHHDEALARLRDVLLQPAPPLGSGLAKVNLMFNVLGVEGAQVRHSLIACVRGP